MRRIDLRNVARLGVWTDGTDTVVAYSDADAIAICEELSGDSYEGKAADWCRIDDEKLVPIANAGPNETRLELTAIDWVIYNGRGFLCSTEW